MATQLRLATIDPAAPDPSVEAILHAVIPEKFVDHTHADAVLSLTNTVAGEKLVREVFAERVVTVPYVRPGCALAKLCAELLPKMRTGTTAGLILMNHGIFSFGETARESYDRMISLVSRAEEFLCRRRNPVPVRKPHPAIEPARELEIIPALRKEISQIAGRPMIVSVRKDDSVAEFIRRPDLFRITQEGPATPDHLIHTKRVPLLGRDVAGYADRYRAYFARYAAADLRSSDPAPRVLLDAELGLLAIGETPEEAQIVAELYEHTIKVIEQAVDVAGWRSISEQDAFAAEYGESRQANLARARVRPDFGGEVVLITGAASGIGRACVESFLARGAAVAALDLNPAIGSPDDRISYLGIQCDLVEETQVREAFLQIVRRFGGIDMLILNAGVFPPSRRIERLLPDEWQRTFAVNLDANLGLLRQAHPLLRNAPRGGRIVVNASKNVPAPGPGAAAYSASKAALTQLARVAALEWGAEGIRVNILHPNAVFDTGIWTPDILESRARHYGMSVDQYKRSNVLGVEVTSRHVAEVAASLCSDVFSRTTGAQIPIDGGNERVI
jgi:rhamnose utilization protein RhaD (predicted bifunctional aldolase and dehydrogenase)/NAD(P)-dependent dehydrogenase (short-subunit alcohol dehydrogenase family)